MSGNICSLHILPFGTNIHTRLLPLPLKEDSNYSFLPPKLKHRSFEQSMLIFRVSAEHSLHLGQEIGHAAAQLCLILDLQRPV